MTLTFIQGHNCQSWQIYALTCTLIVISRKIFKLWHSSLAWRYAWYILMVVLITLTLMQADSGSSEEQIQLWIILTAKKQYRLKFTPMVGHNHFYFSLKSSVSVVLNYGHMSISCKTYVRSQVSQCLLSKRAFGVQTNDVILLSRLILLSGLLVWHDIKWNNVPLSLIAANKTT